MHTLCFVMPRDGSPRFPNMTAAAAAVAVPGARTLLHRAKNLVLPKNPLDDLIDRLGGAKNVAEMTGRNKRMERDTQAGGYRYVKRTDYYGGCSVDDVSIRVWGDGARYTASALR